MSRASIGDYVVTSKLGSGSFAVVYKGYHKVTKVPVAIKAMSLSKLNSKLLANLEMEIAIMRQIDHPNVVKLYEIKKTEKHMYLMLEFCAGGDLQQYMRRQHQQKGVTTLSETVAQHFLRELAKGMKCLWTHNLIHRDLKPQNLLLTEDSSTASLKIADFGFARHLATTSMAETLCGSPLYMAPEILKFQKYDSKADLWSVGTILYEMVVGKPPYGGSNHVQLLANIERNELRFPKDFVISDPCRELLRGLLHRRPENRIGFDDFFKDQFVGLKDDASLDAKMGSFQSYRMTTSIREEENEDDEEEKVGTSNSRPSIEQALVSSSSTVGSEQKSPPKEREVVLESKYGSAPPQTNMEVLQNVFGSASSTHGGTYSSSSLRRSSRLGRSRRATSSGAILVNQNANSPKLSPQMSPNVLPTPSPRINPFREPTSTDQSGFASATSSSQLRHSGSSNSASQRVSRTLVTAVQKKNGSNHALDSSGEYVLVESGTEKTRTLSPPLGMSDGGAPRLSVRTSASDRGRQISANVAFSHEYARQLVDIVHLRIQAIAPIADHLWKMSAALSPSMQSASISAANLASVFSLSSSTSSTSGHALVNTSASSVVVGAESLTVAERKQFICAAEALTLYVKCMRMIQQALIYLRQDPALSKRLPSGSDSPMKTAMPWTETSRKVSMAYLVEQMNGYLDRADQCKKRMFGLSSNPDVASELRALVVSQEELLYTHAIRLGKEGAVKEVLGQSRAAYELYLQATLLLESMSSESALVGGSSSTALQAITKEDQQRVSGLLMALEQRLKTVKCAMDEQTTLRPQSPPLVPRPAIPHKMPSPHALVTTSQP
ncbi:hypothetical protein Poli38472_006895 [Pythium oligandrum]|uniref:Protein kinase domain-containing protein n=1 Tax=Pythium oligandrum TaxID=41045 RepID=A0A8K1C939_PYTOL|nr:hypothetical protein Poli38472_006895 [Pythium oligandrum]|eukprot:TMW58750.1 hypothetical protein Poli38472_006895 [Pythium oligandrum]